MRKEGFTVIEVMTVLIIMAILATLAVPPLVKTMDAAKGRLAKTNLQLIYAAEKVYRNEVGSYMPIPDSPRMTVGVDDDEFKKFLGLDIKDDARGFRYEVVSTGDSFTGRAIYQGSRYPGAKIIINEDGTITTEGWPFP